MLSQLLLAPQRASDGAPVIRAIGGRLAPANNGNSIFRTGQALCEDHEDVACSHLHHPAPTRVTHERDPVQLLENRAKQGYMNDRERAAAGDCGFEPEKAEGARSSASPAALRDDKGLSSARQGAVRPCQTAEIARTAQPRPQSPSRQEQLGSARGRAGLATPSKRARLSDRVYACNTTAHRATATTRISQLARLSSQLLDLVGLVALGVGGRAPWRLGGRGAQVASIFTLSDRAVKL